MQITPAILTDDLSVFKSLVTELEFAHSIDIDIIRPPFVENHTLQLSDIFSLVNPQSQSVGIHLMVADPKTDLEMLKNLDASNLNLRIYLHQESDLDFLSNFHWPQDWLKGITIKLESELKETEFYNNFDEVQFMSIETGKQGNPFNNQVIDKIEKLTASGYFGKISIDGGINLETIGYLKGFPVDRVSVGSFLQKSQNIKESYRMLEKVLEN